jgi:hypothetical protein
MPRARSFVSDVISQSTAPPSNAFVRQSIFNNWPGQSANGDPQNTNQSLTLPSNVLATSALVVFGTLSNGGSVVAAPTLNDTLNGAGYTKLEQTDDTNSVGWQSTFLFYLPNSLAGAYRLDVVFANVEWQGIAVLEVTNVPAAPLIDHKSAKTLGYTATTTDDLSSGVLAGAGNKAILIGLGQTLGDASVLNGGSGLGRPNKGTNFTTLLEVWNDNGEENTSFAPTGLIETQFFASMGNVAATFTGTGGTAPDDLAMHAVALLSN